jgi:hypothetical protein
LMSIILLFLSFATVLLISFFGSSLCDIRNRRTLYVMTSKGFIFPFVKMKLDCSVELQRETHRPPRPCDSDSCLK